jgi:hypothetical protein
MKTYIGATGAVFGLIALAHVWRIFAEGWGPARNPWFIVTTILSVSLCGWAFRLLRAASR